MSNQLSKSHLLTKVLMTNRQEVIVHLYEGSISYLQRAIADLEENDKKEAAESINRTVQILIELSGNLNYNASEQAHLALRLDAIYNYLIETLSLAVERSDVDAVKVCKGILVVLHDAWEQAVAIEGKLSDTNAQGQQILVSV